MATQASQKIAAKRYRNTSKLPFIHIVNLAWNNQN